MEQLIEGFGLDWKILIAQMINFGIVLLVLWKFAYKPLKRMLSERTAKIDKSLKDAEKIEQDLIATDKQREETLSKARQDGQALLEKTKAEGEQLKAEMSKNAKVEVEKIVGNAHAEIAQAKERMIAEAKQELGDMVVSASEEILREKLNDKTDKALIDNALKKVK